MKKIVIVVLIFCAVLVAYLLNRYEIFGEKTPAASAITEKVSSPTLEKPGQANDAIIAQHLAQDLGPTADPIPADRRELSLKQRVEIMQKNRPGRALTESEIKEALAEPDAWKTSTTRYTDLGLTNEEIYDGRVFIDLKPFKIESLMEGDTVTFPIPFENGDITLVVDRAAVQGDTLQLQGKGQGSDTSFSISSPQKNSMAGGITTATNYYTFHIQDGRGWIQEPGKSMTINPDMSASPSDSVMPNINADIAETPPDSVMPNINSDTSDTPTDAIMPTINDN